MTVRERDALAVLARTERPLLLALNKADRYSEDERERLLGRLREHAAGLVHPIDVVAVSATPPPLRHLRSDGTGREHAENVDRDADISALRDRLGAIVEREGRTLAALNASLFAGRVSDGVGARIVEGAPRDRAKVIRRTVCRALPSPSIRYRSPTAGGRRARRRPGHASCARLRTAMTIAGRAA